jgi:hypothetical protein
MSCSNNCTHERHSDYLGAFSASIKEDEFLKYISKFLLDSRLSPFDADDLDLYQDLVFDSKWGRLHIFYYEDLFSTYYIRPVEFAKKFSRHLDYLGQCSVLFLLDAFTFILKKNNPYMVNFLMKFMSLKTKLLFIRETEHYPQIVQAVPKLKLYNLFS